ncbi:cytochrome P450 [Corynespora cassiicola Philippines]|uniref:Cytochrome P450 n=1 Tax=Corynespora cassiicola Philippines TaxID=1448308 RepID=A0A2T2NLG2_CORCC|nr:cytochrome P450 [Corynespora cassiicola Philippines]
MGFQVSLNLLTMSLVLYLLIGLLLAVGYKIRNVGRRAKDLPPGPPTLPIIGNLHQIPKEKPHHQFKKWADEYGPVYSLILGNSVLVVLSSDQAIKDLLDKRSNIYSSRPPLYIGHLLSGGLRMLFMEYGPTWRMIRKTIHNHLNIKAAKSYIPYQDLENRQMLLDLLERPNRWKDHLRRYTNSLTTQMVFGFRTQDVDDPKMHQLYDGFADFSECVGSAEAKVFDVFPFLKHVPDFLVPIKRRANRLHEEEHKLYLGHWMDVKKRIQNGTANPCICVDLANSQNVEKFSDSLAAYISCSLLEAGSDTTSSTLVGFIQAMLLFPEVAKTAQEEIDRVCGDRLPTLEDEMDMQYVRGCVKESMRWMPTGILGIPHAPIQDDIYNGWRIPKGSAVMWNVWGVHHDEKRSPNPRLFDPTRYANDYQSAAEAAANPDVTQRDHFLFGAGRRVCQGMHIADRSLFLAISRMLWAFNIELAQDDKGQDIVPNADDLTEGMLVLPKDFPVKIVRRSEERAALVRKEWDMVSDKLDESGQWKRAPDGMFFKEYIPLA